MAAKKPDKKPDKKPVKKLGKKSLPTTKNSGASQLSLAPTESVQPVQLQDEMERSFLDYAMSVIMSRALPDVRDGLKPVHRRIIWDMHQQGFRPDRPFVKCARVTGDTMARYHPHGDGAIYDALVRMAQPFSLRHPLIDFHGNYGSPDFGPAASRYTESRLHPLAMQLLADIDEDTVDLIANYDGTSEEPSVLPARFPNLLVNGSQGIAVGMATSIPPHNLGEVVDATLHLIDNPEASIADLMKFVKGPDFPTGGLILGRSGINDAYKTGRGSIKMRAKVAIEEGQRNQMRIVVTELPYQASCSAIAARIQELVDGGDLDGIADVNDNSSGGEHCCPLLLTFAQRRAALHIAARLPGQPIITGAALKLKLLGERPLLPLRPGLTGIGRDKGSRDKVARKIEGIALFCLGIAGDVLDGQRIADFPRRGVDHLPLALLDEGIGKGVLGIVESETPGVLVI